MRLRAFAAGVVLACCGLAGCSDDDGGITVRTDVDASATVDVTDAPDTTDRATTTADRTTTTADDATTTSTSDDDATTTTRPGASTTSTTTGGDDEATSTTAEGGSGPGGTYPAPIRALFVQAFEGQGLTTEQAECVVGVVEELVPYEDLATGDISAVTENQAELGDEVVERCDIDLNTLGPATTG